MQAEASTLPVVQLNVHKKSDRKSNSNSKSSTLESKKLPLRKSTLFTSNKKCLNPLLGGPYKSSIKQQSLSDEPRSSNKSFIGQRVMSAKLLRFKQLQNQLADAHYHLNELANENRLLKALQKRQDSALRRYEGTNAELPRIINSHHEELRILQTKYKKLKELHRDTCNLLKEKENELYTVNSQNKHLLQLSKDRNLGEREKLQLQISDMNHELQQQQETIQILHRKLALETKSLKHQLHVEIFKHKETQKNLQGTIEKLKTLECLLGNREKRLYYNGQLPIYNKEKNLGSHSFTNLSDVSALNPVKVSGRNKKSETSTPKDNLPLLDVLESNDDEKVTKTNNTNHPRDQLKSETMTNLHQIRKFRLQKSPHMHKLAHSMNDLRFRFKDLEVEAYDNEKVAMYQDALVDFKSTPKRNSFSDDKNERESGRLRKLFNRMKSRTSQNLKREMELESDYSSDDADNENANEHNIEHYSADNAQKSRELYARLINGTGDTSDTLDGTIKRINAHYSDDEEEEKELSTHLMEDLAFQKRKYKSRSDILQHHRSKEFDDSEESEVDFEERIGESRDYSSREYNADLSEYGRKQFSKYFNNTSHLEYNTSEIKEPSEPKNTELQRIPGDTLDDIHTKNVKIPAQTSEETWSEQLSENNGIDKFFTDARKEENKKKKEMKYSETKPAYTDISHDTVYHDTFEQNNGYEEIKGLPSPKREDQTGLQQAREECKTKIVSSAETEYVKPENSEAMSSEDKTTLNYSEGDDYSMHSLVKEYRTLRVEETPSAKNRNYGEETLKEKNFDVETKNRLNASLETEDGNVLSNVPVSHTEQASDRGVEVTDTKETIDMKKKVNYNKEKLLATMKAIDNNENIEFLNQGFKNHNVVSRMQITQNLYRGVPTHSKPKRDIIKDIFEDNHIENKVRGTCSKSH